MGLVVLAVVVVFVACMRSLRAWVTGVPALEIAMHPRPAPLVRRLVDGIGKVKVPARETAPLAPESVHRLRIEAMGDAALPRVERSSRTGCDVLVVGAGPSGLMMATLLARGGLSVRIVDKGAGPATESRAFAVQAKTVELFRNLGLADELLRCGVLDTGIQFHIKGRPVGGLDFDRSKAEDTPYQFILMAPQNEVEGVLLAELTRLGVQVERDSELVTLTQTDSGAIAGIKHDGQVACILSSYVVGADGAHSLVRKQLGLPFEGAKYAQTFLLADCRVRWPYDHANFRIFMNGERIGLFLPLKGGELSRVMATDLETMASGNHGPTPGPVELAALQDSLSKAMCVPIELSNPVWTTRYSVHMRVVDRYSLGRGFLVGDAAHIHSPAGGQGMNTGLLDAANLAWKLTMVARTGAGTDLLDSYNDERHPVGVQLMGFTDRLYRLTADLRGWRAWARDFFGPFVVGRMSAAPLPHRKSFRRLSQISLEYKPSRFNVNGLLYSLRGPVAGQRAPDARIRAGRQMFDLLAGYRLHVVVFSRKHLVDDEVAEYSGQLQSIAAFGIDIATHLVGRVECRHDARVEQVQSVQVFNHYGLMHDDSKALFVIRPDGHVGWRLDDVDFDACRSFLARLHGGFAAYEARRVAVPH